MARWIVLGITFFVLVVVGWILAHRHQASVVASILPLASPSPKLRALEKISQFPEVRKILVPPGKHSLQKVDEVQGSRVQTTKFQHYYRGIEVIGSMVFYHQGPAGEQVQVHLAAVELDVKPKISTQDALSLARASAGKSQVLEAPQLRILPSSDLKSAQLVYRMKIESTVNAPPHEVWVNAHTGKLIADIARGGFFSPLPGS